MEGNRIGVEQPTVAVPAQAPAWGSDAIAETLRALGLPFVSLNPGASYRGLHDSLVNHLGNERPQMIVCLHEEHAVALAHGYAKATGRPMAVALHANVGLMHATMALFNAFCDRVPMVVIGATGPLDATRRRPWIDWIHTAADQGALIRNYVKWDDQPVSVAAAIESLVRADAVTRAYPSAPTYVCLDAALQEAPLDGPPPLPEIARHGPPPPPAPGPATVAAAFPSEHRLHPVAPGTFLAPEGAELLRRADVVLALDWVDLGGTLRQAWGADPVDAQVISASNDSVLHNGWSKDHFALAPTDVPLCAHPDLLVEALLAEVSPRPATPGWPPPAPAPKGVAGDHGNAITVGELAGALRGALAGRNACLARVPLGWSGADWSVAGPLDYLGQDGGAGLGSGPGMAVGVALALRGSDRLAVAVLGDGDLLMGATALWTAARYGLGMLVVVANNGTYLNDEIHQERVARARSRPVENRWVAQQIRDPDPDLAALARSIGLVGVGPVSERDALGEALATAVVVAASGVPVLVDVRVLPGDEPGARSDPPAKESQE